MMPIRDRLIGLVGDDVSNAVYHSYHAIYIPYHGHGHGLPAWKIGCLIAVTSLPKVWFVMQMPSGE